MNFKKITIWLRRVIKKQIGPLLLSPYYRLCCLQPVQKNLVVFADGHQNTLPYSMKTVYKVLKSKPRFTVVCYTHDYSFCSMWTGLKIMLKFMPLYARAEYVFLSDCYFPASCCNKRKETTVVQLWHSCGLMKKIGRDCPEEFKNMTKNQYHNIDVFTTSGDIVADVMSKALDIPRDHFCKTGVPRMDMLFSQKRSNEFRQIFYAKYPEYVGKRIVLWAPTFRGNVRDAHLEGLDEILRLQNELEGEYVIAIKPHRYIKEIQIDHAITFSSEQLLPITDILITDYSSLYFDYLYFRKPIVLFAPDLDSYIEDRGIYPDYHSMPGKFARDYTQLKEAVCTTDIWANEAYQQQLNKLWDEQMNFCNGRSTYQLLDELGMLTAQ